jgi:hypothetical protein
MLRRLTWVILTLPLATCVCLWVDSYWHHVDVTCLRDLRQVAVGVDTGFVFIASQLNIRSNQGWYFIQREAYGRSWVNEDRSILGFACESDPRHGYVAFQVPMWSIALLTLLPPLWFFRRQRKYRKIGFPVSAAAEKN